MKHALLAFGLAASSFAATAADIDGTYTCLTTDNTQPVSVYKETLVVATQADGSVRLSGEDGGSITGTRSGSAVAVSGGTPHGEISGRWEFNGDAMTSTYTATDNGMAFAGSSKCRRGSVVPTDNAIGAYASADGWKNGKWIGYDAMHLDIAIPNVPAGSCGAQKVWIGALLPSGSWFFHDANHNWTTAGASGDLPPADHGTGGAWGRGVLDEGMGATLRAIVGTQFYVGYGCSVSDMVSRGTFARVYTLN